MDMRKAKELAGARGLDLDAIEEPDRELLFVAESIDAAAVQRTLGRRDPLSRFPNWMKPAWARVQFQPLVAEIWAGAIDFDGMEARTSARPQDRALAVAVWAGDAGAAAKALAQGADPDGKLLRLAPLSISAWHPEPLALKLAGLLLAAGASPRDSARISPLCHAAALPALVRLLARAGGDLEPSLPDWSPAWQEFASPYQCARSVGSAESLAALLSARTEDQVDRGVGHEAFIKAAMSGQEEVVAAFLAAGCDPLRKFLWVRSPLREAFRHGRAGCAALMIGACEPGALLDSSLSGAVNDRQAKTRPEAMAMALGAASGLDSPPRPRL